MGNLSRKDKEHIRSGAWHKTVNEPIPEHVKEAAAKKNPLHGAVVIGTTPYSSLAAEAEAEYKRNKPGR